MQSGKKMFRLPTADAIKIKQKLTKLLFFVLRDHICTRRLNLKSRKLHIHFKAYYTYRY